MSESPYSKLCDYLLRECPPEENEKERQKLKRMHLSQIYYLLTSLKDKDYINNEMTLSQIIEKLLKDVS